MRLADTDRAPNVYTITQKEKSIQNDECKAIDRDVLLERLGDYETTYIYTGKYNEYGKYSDIVYPVA